GTQALPWATDAYRVNVLSAFWTAACVGLLSLCLFEITNSLVTALLTGLILGCGPLWMNQALVSEVFALNSFLAGFLIYLALRPRSLQAAALSAYVLGVGLGNHHTLILLAPALLLAFWPVIRARPVNTLGLLTVFFLVGLSIY